MTERIPVSCNRDCISGCPLEAEVVDGVLVRIRNSPHKTPLMNGCPRGFLFPEAVYNPERITTPLIRVGAERTDREDDPFSFRRATWDEALDLVAGKLSRIRDLHGPQAVMRIGGSGACRGAFHHTALIPMRFFTLFGGYTDTTGSFSSQATEFVKPFVYGTKDVGIDVKTLLDSRMIVLWGFNAADTRFGPETESVLRNARERGIPIVAIDPRRTRTVKRYNAEWLPVYPGSDSALMLAMLHVLLSRGLTDRRYIDRYSIGFDALEAYVLGRDGTPPKTPEWAEPRCGLSAAKIRDFTIRFAAAKPAALLPGLSVQRTVGGEDVDRLGGVLQIALKNVGVRGGSSGTGQWNSILRPRCGELPVPPVPHSSVVPGADRSFAAVPVYQWADAVLGGTDAGWPSDVRFLYNVGGNYLIQGSDVEKNLRAFRKATFVVTHDSFFTDTARYSDVILPTTTFVEREDIVFGATNHLYYSHKAIEPVGEARNDWDIFVDLARRLGFDKAFTAGRTPRRWLDLLLAESEVPDPKEFRRRGIYAGKDQSFVGLSRFIEDPDGTPLSTESGRIEIACPSFERAGGTLIPQYRGPEPPLKTFLLVTPHERMRNNSQFDNIPAFAKNIDEFLWINAGDAASSGISDGDSVTLLRVEDETASPEARSRRISTRVLARVTEDIMPGVLSWSQGGWLFRKRRNDVGRTEESGNPNMLSSTIPTTPSNGARTHSIRVTIERF